MSSYISTGLKKSKFGISADRALEEFKLASSLKHVEVVGVHKHIGSQLTEVAPFVEALKKILALVQLLRETVSPVDLRFDPRNVPTAQTARASAGLQPVPHRSRKRISERNCARDASGKGPDLVGSRRGRGDLDGLHALGLRGQEDR